MSGAVLKHSVGGYGDCLGHPGQRLSISVQVGLNLAGKRSILGGGYVQRINARFQGQMIGAEAKQEGGPHAFNGKPK